MLYPDVPQVQAYFPKTPSSSRKAGAPTPGDEGLKGSTAGKKVVGFRPAEADT
jgi:hypothetical protein